MYTRIAVAHALHRVRLGLRRLAWPSLVARHAVTRCRAPGGPWLDLTVPNSVSDENCGGSDGARHEPDVPAPDAVPNAVPHALPLLRNAGDASIGS